MGKSRFPGRIDRAILHLLRLQRLSVGPILAQLRDRDVPYLMNVKHQASGRTLVLAGETDFDEPLGIGHDEYSFHTTHYEENLGMGQDCSHEVFLKIQRPLTILHSPKL